MAKKKLDNGTEVEVEEVKADVAAVEPEAKSVVEKVEAFVKKDVVDPVKGVVEKVVEAVKSRHIVIGHHTIAF